MNLGADDYITKPFDESELFSAIESRLAKVAIIKENIVEEENSSISEVPRTLNQLKNYFVNTFENHFFNPGEIIFREGDNSNFIYLIAEGVVKTYKIEEQGKELMTGLYKENDFFWNYIFLT